MKRWLAVGLLAVLLTGCTSKTPAVENDVTQIIPPTEEDLYDEEHTVESETDGAVKAYAIADRQCVRLVAMGEHYLMLGEDTITLMKGESLAPSVTVQITNMQESAVCIRDDGVAYHDKASGSIVFLNEHLRKNSTLNLPDGVIGDVIISADWQKIYYCASEGIAVLDVATGIASTLLVYEADWQGINGSFQNGTVLRCVIKTQEGDLRTIAVNAQTGALLTQGDHLQNLIGRGRHYFLEKQAGGLREYIIGTENQQPCSFTPAEPLPLIPLPDVDKILQPIQTVYGVTVDTYQISTGKRIASVDLPGITELTCVGAEADIVWFVSEGILYSWDTTKSQVTDETLYKTFRFTREDPDEEGLQRVKERLTVLEQQYGVQFHYWEEPKNLVPWEYVFETEFIPEAYEAYLDELEYAMGQFPDDFFQKAAQWTDSGKLQILLLRGIYGGPEGYASASGIQYNINGETYLALSLQEGLEQNFYHVLGHLVDAKILSSCEAYRKWEDLNPWDFKYDNDYTKNQDRTGTKYIEGEKRYFVDHYAMSFAVEDRARILEYACMPGNEEVFASKYMQKKLKTVCAGIREAFELTGEEYIWEQYLKK